MASEKVVKAIDALRAREGSSLLQRLAEAAAFVPISEVDRALAIEEMIEDERRHGQRLAELLDAFDATPGPRRVEASSAEMNYDELGTQIPRLIESKKRLIAAYEAGAALVAEEPEAANLIATITAKHREHLDRLKKLQPTTTT